MYSERIFSTTYQYQKLRKSLFQIILRIKIVDLYIYCIIIQCLVQNVKGSDQNIIMWDITLEAI